MAVMVGAYNGGSPPEHVPHVIQRTSGLRIPRARIGQAGTRCSPIALVRIGAGRRSGVAPSGAGMDDWQTLRSERSRSIEGPGEVKRPSRRRVGPLPIQVAHGLYRGGDDLVVHTVHQVLDRLVGFPE